MTPLCKKREPVDRHKGTKHSQNSPEILQNLRMSFDWHFLVGLGDLLT